MILIVLEPNSFKTCSVFVWCRPCREHKCSAWMVCLKALFTQHRCKPSVFTTLWPPSSSDIRGSWVKRLLRSDRKVHLGGRDKWGIYRRCRYLQHVYSDEAAHAIVMFFQDSVRISSEKWKSLHPFSSKSAELQTSWEPAASSFVCFVQIQPMSKILCWGSQAFSVS